MPIDGARQSIFLWNFIRILENGISGFVHNYYYYYWRWIEVQSIRANALANDYVQRMMIRLPERDLCPSVSFPFYFFSVSRMEFISRGKCSFHWKNVLILTLLQSRQRFTMPYIRCALWCCVYALYHGTDFIYRLNIYRLERLKRTPPATASWT